MGALHGAARQQVLRNEAVSCAVDLWALGCLVFQMLAGRPPFRDASEYLTLERVSTRDFSFPLGFPPDARDLVDRLLADDPPDRLGELLLPLIEGLSWRRPMVIGVVYVGASHVLQCYHKPQAVIPDS